MICLIQDKGVVLWVMGCGIWYVIDKSTNYKAPTGIIIKSNIKIMMCLVFVFYLNNFRAGGLPISRT